MGTLHEEVDSKQKSQPNFNEVVDEEDEPTPSRAKSLKRKVTR